jgi:PRA1 family protein 1
MRLPSSSCSPSGPALTWQAATRLRKNTSYFKINYLLVMVLLLILSFAMHPGSLFVLALLLGAWMYLFVIRQAPLTINGRTFRYWSGDICHNPPSLCTF